VSVGADGVIFAGPVGSGDGVDIVARFFEPDGSEVELCGNGVGSFCYWVIDRGFVTPGKREIRVLTSAGVVRGKKLGDNGEVRVCIPTPRDMKQGLELEARGRHWSADYLLTGVPHLVTWVDDLGDLDVFGYGRALRRHEAFAPRGVNVNFVQVLDQGRIAVRTFEFGVEDETLACGTGSSSAAILTALRKQWNSDFRTGQKPVEVNVQSGDTLRVWFEMDDQGDPVDVCLDTLVRPVYKGTLDGRLARQALTDRQPCPATTSNQ
ncbi:MAG: diaminopimelate epimerase, partial [Planctomycetota bacterium]